ncbi:MAG TPA: tetratricopeptide repeat protein [Planctomycetaceae bacterium]|nr:tetratricopeptide repeat protein [Planctomycetaceae bacterium]
MAEPQTEQRTFAGRRVAFTGRLAAMSRRTAAEMLERRGATVSESVNRQTDLLVVGREGWPLRADGRLTRKLIRARTLQRVNQALEIIPEEQFLHRLQVNPLEDYVLRSCSIAELTELLDLPRSRLESWQRAGVIVATERREGLPYFDFRQVSAIRSLHRLLSAGVAPRRVARSLSQLREWMDEFPSLDLLPGLFSDGSRFLFRTDGGRLAETTGQLLFEFDADSEVAALPFLCRVDADTTFAEAIRLEKEGRLAEAAACYRMLLHEDGLDAEVCFNLANVLHAAGDKRAAIDWFHEAVALDPEMTDAWNNVGNLLAEIGNLAEACRAYRRAVDVEPAYADAHYGLADVLEQLGRWDEARGHWRTYLQIEQAGPWADYARTRLASHSA